MFIAWLKRLVSSQDQPLQEQELHKQRMADARANFERNSRAVPGAPWLKVRSDLDVIITSPDGFVQHLRPTDSRGGK